MARIRKMQQKRH